MNDKICNKFVISEFMCLVWGKNRKINDKFTNKSYNAMNKYINRIFLYKFEIHLYKEIFENSAKFILES